MIPKHRLDQLAFFLMPNWAGRGAGNGEVLVAWLGGSLTLQGSLRVRVGLDEESALHSSSGVQEGIREHESL